MAAIYWKVPTAAQAGAFGLKPDDYPSPAVDLWPDNWPSIDLFNRLATQWRVGAGGPIGLDYTAFFHELDRAGTTGADFDDLMACLRVIERAALNEIHKE